MNDDHARYRRRRGGSIMKEGCIAVLKATVLAGVGTWMADALHTAGTITAGDENLLTVVISLWFSYRLLIALALFAYGQWVASMPPAGELVDDLRQRVGDQL